MEKGLTAPSIIGAERGLRHVLGAVRMVAPTDAAVLIQGETGTGKELIASAVHQGSGRRGAFVKLNCAAMPAGLLESELFGHERGAFTGACSQTNGRFQQAHLGTLFLDEIGELPLALQPKLLRVLQDQEFERVGSHRTVRVDVRIVAATNQNLLKMVQNHEFRADLFFRLNVFPITMVPLRERREDIPDLVHYFANSFARKMHKDVVVPAAILRFLERQAWPGNVRELQNVIERAMILSPGQILQLPAGIDEHLASSGTLADAQRDCILAALEQTGWVIAGSKGAAEKLGIPRTTLMHRMGKLGIERKRSEGTGVRSTPSAFLDSAESTIYRYHPDSAESI